MLSKRIRELRRLKNLSQEILTGKVGVSRKAIGLWESGRTCPTNKNLTLIAKALGVPMEELTGQVIYPHSEQKIAPSPKEERVEIVEHYGLNESIKVPVYEDFMSACAGRGTETEAGDGDVIIAELDGDWMVKWIYWNRHCEGGELRSASLKYPVKKFTQEDIEAGRFRYIGKVCKSMTTPRKGA